MNSEIKIYKTPDLLAEAFADLIAKEIKKKGEYYISLSGGLTPKIIFQALAEKYSDRIDWSGVHFFWGDERCVPPDSNESNYKMAKDTLLDKIDIPSINIHRIKGEAEPAEEAERYSAEILNNLPEKNGLPKFDFIMLGLGEDGHTASIFPDRLDLFETHKICEVVIQPETKQYRITIAGNIINNSGKTAFLITGKNKSEIVGSIFSESPVKNSFPAAHVELTHGILLWFLDEESSSELRLK